jgi:beta-lactamase regulating signal transducer with metallopeptidase domain
MIHFLVTSAISMAVLLAVYHLLLEKEKMNRFNRFYLISSLIFSLMLPFITIPVEIGSPVIMDIPNTLQTTTTQAATVSTANPVLETNYWPYAGLGLYGIVTLILLARFISNIRYFIKKAKHNFSLQYKTAKLVLVEEKTLPHTFMNYIFMNKAEYETSAIEQELFTHELVHVNQKHTLDVIFIELLLIIFWFNPLLYFYKKAIQLNHEFLADEKVAATNNITFYQNLLLSKACSGHNYSLASNLNFSVTKKRFIMMTKNTSVFKAFLLKTVLAPVTAGLLFMLCTKAVAQEIVSAAGTKYYTAAELFAETTFRFTDKEGNVTEKKFQTLNEEEREQVKNHMPNFFVERKQPSQAQLNEWKDSKIFIVWLDDQIISNEQLNKYKPKDIASYEAVIIEDLKASVSQKYNVKLRTQKNFEEMVVERNASPNRKLTLLEFNDLPDGMTVEESVEKRFENMVYYTSATEKQPGFPGGMEAFSKYINSNYNKNFENRRSGTLEVSFVIEKDGSLSDIEVLKDTGGNSKYEIVRVLQNSPKWIPAVRENKVVRSRPDEPIKITLQ